jgi:glutamyl-Q tRNA(Asp) synthetase
LSAGYIGRFAPSPTGPLHFGSLVAATASYVDARAQNGRWLVRMEDLDTPRVEPGAADHILQTLDQFGFEWDGPVLFQSTRTNAYRTALDQLREEGFAYPCGCSRKDAGERYAGTCRSGLAPGKGPRAWRVRVPCEPVMFEDRVQGRQCQNVEEYCGDIVVLRADGLFAYQLAVVVDDRDQGITDVVRGADLLDSTARQIHLQRMLGARRPRYLHTPVVMNAQGQKLSKQTKAPAVDAAGAVASIFDALRFLRQDLPPASDFTSKADVWRWAIANWDPSKLRLEVEAQR